MTTSLTIKTLTLSHFQQNTRLLFNEHEQLVMIIDPGFDEDLILKESCLDKYTLHSIVLTHAHLDHAGAVQPLLIQLAKFNISAPLYYHSNEQPIAANIETLSNLYGLSGLYHNAPKATKWIDSMPSLHFGTIMFSILETPGHSPGHICLFTTPTQTHLTGQFSEPCHPNQPILIGGDTLFQGSIGRTDLPLANHDQLITSIHSKLLTLPDDTIVLSGHGPNTTIGQEKQTNPFLI